MACRRLYAAISDLDRRIARTAGISVSDLQCLNLLEAGPVTPRDIAGALELTSGAVTGLIDRLEAKGLVERRPNPKDRRSVVVAGTPHLFASIGPQYRRVATALRAFEDGLGDQAPLAATHLEAAAAAYALAASAIENDGASD
ncbi:MAG: MarR family transcriptional regulator [Pseudomonadota bacterium]